MPIIDDEFGLHGGSYEVERLTKSIQELESHYYRTLGFVPAEVEILSLREMRYRRDALDRHLSNPKVRSCMNLLNEPSESD